MGGAWPVGPFSLSELVALAELEPAHLRRWLQAFLPHSSAFALRAYLGLAAAQGVEVKFVAQH